MIPVLHQMAAAKPYYALGSGSERPGHLPDLLAFVGNLESETENNQSIIHLLGGSALSEVADIAIAQNNYQAARSALTLSDELYAKHLTSHQRLVTREITFNHLRHALMDGTVDQQLPAILRLVTGLALNIPAGKTFTEDNNIDHGDRNELLGLSLILWSRRQGASIEGRTFLGWPTYLRQDAPGRILNPRAIRYSGSDIRLSQYTSSGSEHRIYRRFIDIKSSIGSSAIRTGRLVDIQAVSGATTPGGSRHLLKAMHHPSDQLTPKQKNRLTTASINFFATMGLSAKFPELSQEQDLKLVSA